MHASGPLLEAKVVHKRGCNKVQVILWLQTKRKLYQHSIYNTIIIRLLLNCSISAGCEHMYGCPILTNGVTSYLQGLN